MKFVVAWFVFTNNSVHVAGPFDTKAEAVTYAGKLISTGDVIVAVRELTKP